jgi:hypothetical protein
VRIWPQEEIQALFREAAQQGEVSVELADAAAARKFSFACFNWRRASVVADVLDIQVFLDDTRVTLRRKAPAPLIRRVETPETWKMSNGSSISFEGDGGDKLESEEDTPEAAQ